MMGSTHAATGAFVATATLAVTPLAVTVSDVVVVGLVAAGAALLPDLDSRSSTATHSLGPATRAVSRGVRTLSVAAWRWTATPRDRSGPERDREHRHLNHTLVAAVGWGVLAAVVAALHPLVALLVVVGLGGLGAVVLVRAIPGGRSYAPLMSAATAVGIVFTQWQDPFGPAVVGVTVGAGMAVGIVGDWFTSMGVPLAWPARVRGKRWWQYRSPWTFATSRESPQEKWIRRICLIGTLMSVVFVVLGA